MFTWMRTTLDLDDDLLIEAKRLAAERRTTLTAVLEDALRIVVRRAGEPKRRRRSTLPTFGVPGEGFMPGVDISDNVALLDVMEQDLPLHKRR
jgi:hypothetical protein